MQFNKCLENIRMSPIVSISEEAAIKATEFEESGKLFIKFQRGEINFSTPLYIRKAIKKALNYGYTKYPKSGGEKVFKEAVINDLMRRYLITDLKPSNIVATYGGQEALELCFQLFAGGKGAGFSPTWSCALENFIPYAGIDFTEIPLNEDFSIDFDLLASVVRGIDFFYLNNPHNPTGKVFNQKELEQITQICSKENVYIIADEAYERILYDENKHITYASLPWDNIITVFTLSKSFSMTGWRIGYVVTRNEKIAKLLKLGNYTQTAGVTTFIQHAAAEALNNQFESEFHLKYMISRFQTRRDALYNGMKDLKGVKLYGKPQGAFYIFPNFTDIIPKNLIGEKRNKYIYKLLMDNGIASVYGSCFGQHFSDNVRFSFSGIHTETIIEGVKRMKEIFNV